MTVEEFKELLGKDLVVDYPFFNELQQWSMKNFYVDENGEIRHKRLPMNIPVFISGASNPHKGNPTHG